MIIIEKENNVVRYTFINKSGHPQTVDIPDEYIARTRKSLGCSNSEAINLFLSDEGYVDNAVVQELTDKAKGQTRRAESAKKRTVTRQPDLVKRDLIDLLDRTLRAYDGITNLEVTNIERMLRFTIGEDNYELTLSKKRK